MHMRQEQIEQIIKLIDTWKNLPERSAYCNACDNLSTHVPSYEVIYEGNKLVIKMFWTCLRCGRRKGIY